MTQRDNRNNTDEISPRTPSICCSGPLSFKTCRWKPRVRPLVDWLTFGRRSIHDLRSTTWTMHVITPAHETPRRHVANSRRLDIHNQPTFTNATRRFYHETCEAPKMSVRHVSVSPVPDFRDRWSDTNTFEHVDVTCLANAVYRTHQPSCRTEARTLI